jgi:hypothetical protein
MYGNYKSRSVLIRVAGIAAVMISATGCPSGGDGGDAPTAAVEQSPPQPVAEPETPVVEPALLPEQPEAAPITEPPSPPSNPAAEPAGSVQQKGGTPGQLPNPLREGPEPPLRDEAATDPVNHSAEHHPKKAGEEPFDPIKVNGPIFVGWPKPKLALVITGRLDGYLEPCGCAGLDRMKGGMSRRHSFFNQLRNEKGWPVVAVDVGGLAKGYGIQAEQKFQIMVMGMRQMGYDAIALGKAELRMPAGNLVAETLGPKGPQGPFLSANVGLFGAPGQNTLQTRVIEAAGVKLGITGVLGQQFQKAIRSDDVAIVDPETALSAVIPDLKEKADYLILLAHASVEESRALARKFPDFDLVVTAGGAPEPPAKPARIEGTKTLLIEVGQKGMDAIVLGIFDDPKQRFRYQRVPLDSRFPASQQMLELMRSYQQALQDMTFAGLGIRPVPHPQKELNGKFVGSEECKICHEKSYIIWKKSGHGKAYDTLTGLDPPRNFDPECVSCHVVGWHPTEYFPYETGYQSLEETPHLTGTGCETCHGPGAAHVDAENGNDFELQEKLRGAVVITKAESQDTRSGKPHCYSCHDLDNSPDFDFETDWPLVEHYEFE